MTAVPDRLDAIQQQAATSEDLSFIQQAIVERDLIGNQIPFLLDLARKQQSALDRARELADKWQEDFPHKAKLIREALEAKP